MKRIIYLFSVICFLALASCDKSETISSRNDIIGIWNANGTYFITYSNIDSTMSYNFSSTYDFRDDGTVIKTQLIFSDTSEWLFQEEPPTLVLHINAFTSEVYEVLELTETTMKWDRMYDLNFEVDSLDKTIHNSTELNKQ